MAVVVFFLIPPFTMAIRFHVFIYQDSHKNVYMMDSQNRLTTFWEGSSKANNKISSSDSQKIDPVDLLQNAIKNTVPNSDNFIVDKNSFTRGCYHILMLRKVDQDVSDSITA
ncbi:hypothetical protein CAFE_09600 [Caprobacter fermentans]|uniref:Uncharacterized protein n=1 Tax=Caproicibacter fermentans TaxID=2576756 RepID=A0A6N8HX91_9FIRM|nr:hypothetical protein [Caproicibacter fermentans]MVB10278.1 hypothetical protein [Caproicibacter fermentans]